MTTAVYYDDRFLDHDTGPGHPERPDRLRAVVGHLKREGLWDRVQHPAWEPATEADVLTLHDRAYVERLRAACEGGDPFIDTPDSTICPASWDAALLAVGAVCSAVDAVARRDVDNALCLVRPPGHHAERDRSMGFCLFANAALAAERLLRVHGLQRVAVVDYDVHHGNGTQHLFESRRDVLFVSLHRDPRDFYPGTGFAEETGTGDGAGFTLNVPLPAESGDGAYEAAFERQVLPALRDYRPQSLVISAGFDAATADPLGGMRVSADGFAWMSEQLINVAKESADGRVVAVLEGGYDLTALAGGVERLLRALLGA